MRAVKGKNLEITAKTSYKSKIDLYRSKNQITNSACLAKRRKSDG
jgi:hypothetical protein